MFGMRGIFYPSERIGFAPRILARTALNFDVLGMSEAAEPIRTGDRRAGGSGVEFWNGIYRGIAAAGGFPTPRNFQHAGRDGTSCVALARSRDIDRPFFNDAPGLRL
jgi:hypothetical protein